MKADTPNTNWSFPCTAWFGAGRIAQIPDAIRQIGATAPLLVTDRGLAENLMCGRIIDVLHESRFETGLFADVQPNPTGENVTAGIEAFKRGGHDAVIALGGGSALDAGKAIAMMIGQTRPIWDFEDIGDNWQRADKTTMAPVVAVPTTAGTGSEFGRSSVISHTEERRKLIIFHPEMLPDLVIMDPELSVGLPSTLTAATGMDALSHALEAWCAPGFHPMADGLAIQAMTMIRDALPRVYSAPHDLDARGQMLVASGMACVALQKGLGAMHAISHPLGALYDAHHGILNAILMPHVMRRNWPAIEDRMGVLSTHLGFGGDTRAVLDWIDRLVLELELPTTLSEIDVSDVDHDRVAQMALMDACAKGNPVEITREMVSDILKAASG